MISTTDTQITSKLSDAKLIEIANLEIDCKIGKDRHFIAADRKNRRRIALGLFSVIGSAMMASESGPALSELFRRIFSEWKYIEPGLKFAGTLLPLAVGISTAVIGFLGLEKQTAQHRFVGNAYIEIARKARSLINDARSGSEEKLLAEYEKLLTKYLEINKEGEACPTNDLDSIKAMQMNRRRRDAIKAKLQEYDLSTLGITEPRPKKSMGLWEAVRRGVIFHAARLLTRLGIVRKTDFRKLAARL